MDPGLTSPLLDGDLVTSPAHLRRDSIAANSSGIISPTTSHGWDSHFGHNNTTAGSLGHMASVDNSPAIAATSTFSAPLYGHHAAQRSMQHPLQQTWGLTESVGDCGSSSTIGDLTGRASFDSASLAHSWADGAQGFTHASTNSASQSVGSMDSAYGTAAQLHAPISPHSHQDWMGLAQQEMEFRPTSKRMRASSPPVTAVDFARRDGIRKKNGRIDIPAERNIHTIDDMIEKTTDEDLLKELKQQKRLLRNREAALASRQRKKKHTEDLEVKEKTYAQQIAILEKDISDLVVDRQHREEERQMLGHRLQDAQRMIESLQDQMREMNFQHTEETSTLRKRINVLTEQLDMGSTAMMSAAPSSVGFADFNAEMEALNMGHDWSEPFICPGGLNNHEFNDFGLSETQHATTQQPPERRTATGATAMQGKKSSENNMDQPIASGLLFMLLLCGAFVASKPPNAKSHDLPVVPPDVRAAAPAVLNSLLSDVPVTQGPSGNGAGASLGAQPSGVAFKNNGRLDQVHQRLITPTKQQEIDQAFALTPAQYASISGGDYAASQQHPTRPRRNLAEALAVSHGGRQQASKAEVYTRSLLWDQIPADVVKQFKEMVRDHQEIEARQGDQRQHDDTYSFKNEA